MNDYSKTKYRYFLLSFSLAFFVLSVMFLFLMSVAHPKLPESLTREPEPGADAVYAPAPEDALSVLFIGVEDEASDAGTFILVRFDPARGKVPVVAFPPQTAVNNSGRTESLAEVYRYGGASYTRDMLQETLGIPIDRYVRIKLDSFIAGASAIGSVEFDLADAVTITQGGLPVTLNPGKQLLDGQKAAAIIRYGSHKGGELERCRVAAGLTAAIVNQRMDICLSTVVDSVFEKLVNLISTDISYPDYYDRKRPAEFLAKLADNPATPIAVSGNWNANNTLYTLSDTFLALLSQTLR